jgi:UDP-N-acetylmuramate dehydrogenase
VVRVAEPGTGHWGAGCPGGADEAAVRTASQVLAPLGARAVMGGEVGPLTTYRVGGRAALLVTAVGERDLVLINMAVRESGLPVLVIGRGSNLLVADSGFGGIAVILDAAGFGAITVEGLEVRAGGAVPLPALARQTVEAGLTGLEWAVGVPGSVGGGVRMNAGGHGSDIAHHLRSCRVVDLAGVDGGPAGAGSGGVGSGGAGSGGAGLDVPVRCRTASDLRFGYRTSAIGSRQVVVEAVFELQSGERDRGRATIRDIVRWRRQHQPGGQNAGSVFTNPRGEPPANSAGWLIDRAGCKGRRWGSAMVSPKHANFIQADSGGSADDVLGLMQMVQHEVHRVHGIRLQPEVRMIGFPQPSTSSGEL